jgi:hypothetical protein
MRPWRAIQKCLSAATFGRRREADVRYVFELDGDKIAVLEIKS